MNSGVHQFEDKLLEFAYGELPRHESEAVEAHLRGCTRCAEALAQIRSVRSAMGALPMEAAPDAGLESLLAYAEQAARRHEAVARPRAWWSFLVVPLASVTAVALVGVFAWRTRDDLQLDPVAVAAGMKREEAKAARAEYAEQQAKNDAAKSVAPVQAPAAAVAPAAVAPQPEPRPKEALKTLDQGTAGDSRLAERPSEAEHLNAQSKRDVRSAPPTKVAKAAEPDVGLLDDFSQGFGTPTDKAPRRESATRQKDAALEKKGQAPVEDYSNSGRQVAHLNDGASVKQAMEGNALGNTLRGSGGTSSGLAMGGLGLGTGSGPSSGGGKAEPKPMAKPSPKKARADLAERSGEENQPVARAETSAASLPGSVAPPPPAAAPVTAVAAQPVAQAAPSMAPAPTGGSLQLGLGRGSLGTGSGADLDAAREAEANTDRKMVADEAAFDARVRTERSRSLAQSARQLLARGDRPAAAKQAVAALTAGADGAARLDALSVACEALDDLNLPDEAAPYCAALVQEYPRTAAARQVAERRQTQLAPTKSGSVKAKTSKKLADPAASKATTKE